MAEFKRYLKIALGSVNEVEVLPDIMKDLGYMSDKDHEDLRSRYEV